MSVEKLREKRRKWVEANRENGFEDGIKRLLTELYPDNAHFIYELLQNAEDARDKSVRSSKGATTVRFTLNQESLAFEHDGELLFSLRDVDSITSIGVSTKRDDPTSIGKFGVGFKAVFAYTNTPEIHSGEFHFRIHDLVVPETDGVEQVVMPSRTTSFKFPFNHPKKGPDKAIEEIENGLRALGDNTLLFLSHIHTIEYSLPDESFGSLVRIEHEGGRIEIRARHPGGHDTVSHWLRFQKEVEVVDEDGKPKSCRIAIAYNLVEDEDKREHRPAWKIVPFNHGQVSIYFPADKETSNLRFHIHAPFASTVARDSVRDCRANHQLRDHIGSLVQESFSVICDRGMLGMSFLAVLPNSMDSLSEFYQPIRKAIVRSFRAEAITPTRSGSHAPATSLYRGPTKIAEVVSDEDLALLLNSAPPLWAANPPQQNQREDRFLDSLEMGDWGWAELVETLSQPNFFPVTDQQKSENRKHKHRIESWISLKDDAWMMRFYALLGEACDSYQECLDADDLCIVRVVAVEGHEHVQPNQAFFPPEQATISSHDIQLVKPTVYSAGKSEAQKKFAVSFLEHIGVRLFDAKAVIELMLAKYEQNPRPDRGTHIKDIEQFIAHWKKNPLDINLFRSKKFLLGGSSEDSLFWVVPTDLCMDKPYKKSGLAEFSEVHGMRAVWTGYSEKLGSTYAEDFVDFLKALGVMDTLKIDLISISGSPHRSELRKSYSYNVKRTITAIDKDYSIKGIEKYLKKKSVAASRLIWDAVIHASRDAATAKFRPNQQYVTREAESQLVFHLKQHAWIPDRSDIFHKPEEMAQEDLPTEFPFDDRNGLLTAIGFGEHAKKRSEEYRVRNQAATSIGFTSAEDAEEIAKLVRETGVTPGELRSLVSQRQRASQPEESVPNPERRRNGVLQRRENAPTKESVTRERSIQPGARPETLEAKAYLRAKYKNVEGQLICQCCHAEMPFKVRDDYYFEAVQCVRGLNQHYFENRLALCPTCAAMYQFARESKDDEIKKLIVEHDAEDKAPSIQIPVRLAGREHTLRFVGTHWFDLKTVLSA